MSIGYSNMYNITAGIFTCFHSKNSKKRMFAVKHPQKKRDDIEKIFPITKYNLKTKEFFILANLYVNFNYGPSSLNASISKLRDLDEKKVLKFKNEIIYYRKYLNDDMDRINAEETNINIDYMTNEYRNNKIKWYTYYFYIIYSKEKKASISELSKSRINGLLVKKIEKLMLYVSFSDKSKQDIKKLFQDRISI